MKNFDVVIVGGGPAGVTCAISAKNTYPDKNLVLIRKEPKTLIPCGIPYTLNTLKNIDDDLLPDKPLLENKVEIIDAEVIGHQDENLLLSNGNEIHYEKLVIATGSVAVMPPIEGNEKKGVFLIEKKRDSLENLKSEIASAEKIVVLGGGYIGVEVADELINMQKDITIVEMKDSLIPTMDEEFGEQVETILIERGCKVITSKSILKIMGDKSVTGVELDDGSIIDCDLLIISCGYKPNLELAKKINLVIEEGKGILVDDYLRTSEKNIFAIGDCAAKYDYFTGEFTNIMLASTAMAEGRLVGSNLFSIKVIRKYQGVLGTFSTKIGNTAFAVSGITERRAKEKGLDYTTGIFKTVDRHPGKIPGASEVVVKLIFSTYSHTLLGAQIRGSDSAGEMINMISVMILNKMTDMEIDTLQIGTHPLLTASPVAYPVINATVDAIKKWYRYQTT